MGWGLTAAGGQSSNLLMELSIPIYDFCTFKANYPKSGDYIIDR
jgi:hypothetical protein